jgi:hypothetical protein
VAFAKSYKTKTPITAADVLNDHVLPFFERHDLPMLQISTDRGTESKDVVLQWVSNTSGQDVFWQGFD